MQRLYKRKFSSGVAWSHEQARELALLSRSINRQLGLLIDRKGKVEMVIVGQATSIFIPELPANNDKHLRGLRLLHTYLGDQEITQEDLLDMLFLRLDAVLTLNVKDTGEPTSWQAAWLNPEKFSDKGRYLIQNKRAWHDNTFDISEITNHIEKELDSNLQNLQEMNPEKRSLLISVSTEGNTIQERNLEELAELVRSAGLEVCGRLIQRVSHPNPRFILGKGKLAELEIMALEKNANILIFDGELLPAQLHNLADITERKVLDRTQIILDIFAQHAVSRAGKLQVELAQLAYIQPRLAGKNRAMDRLAGGIGGRGPGETKLEMDRRRTRQRMSFLQHQLTILRKQRELARTRRARNQIPVVALVGYTNAGKSSLLNKLTKSQTIAEDKLFATLDPATRRLRFPQEREIILSDTVGFIRNLPDELTDAFQATLEELASADLLIHVADSSHPEVQRQIESVDNILEKLSLNKIPKILVLNKIDKAQPNHIYRYPGSLSVSARTGNGLDTLLAKIERHLFISKISDNLENNLQDNENEKD